MSEKPEKVEHEKSADLDESPNSLEVPRPPKSASRKTYNMILAVIAALALIVLWSLFDTGQSEKKKQQEEAANKEAMESRNFMAGEEAGRGVATGSFPKPDQNAGVASPTRTGPDSDKSDKLDKSDKNDDITFVGPPSGNADDEQKRLEAQEDRRKKREAYYSGLGAGIMVHRGGNSANGQQAAAASPDRASGGGGSQNVPTNPDGYDPAADRDKEAFFSRADQSQWMSPYTREAGHPYEMKTGTVIPGLMVTGINSDLPGSIIAQVSQNVYDTATGRFLLVPQGSKIYGAYDSRVVYGQERVLVAWNRIVFPDGSSVTLGAMPGADMSGYAGFADEVDNHYLRIFGSAFLMSLITGGMSYAMDKVDNNNNSGDNATSMQDEMASALAAQMGQTAMKMMEKNMSIKPTIGIRPGYRFNIVVTKDVVFRSPYAAQ